MFSKLATNSSFDKLFPLDCLESFWAQAEKTDDDRLINHPLKKGKSWKKCCLPLFVHGGGVEFQSRDTSWFTAGGHPWARRIHCAVTCTLLASPRAAPWMIPGSLCGSGYHGALQPCKTDTTPPMTPKGRHWKRIPHSSLNKGNPQQKVAGVSCGASKGFRSFSQMQKTMLGMQCFKRCSPSQPVVQNPWKREAGLQKGFQWGGHEEPRKWPQPLQWHDPWLGPKMVRGDCLHILFCKGVLGHLLGGIIHYLCWHDGVGVVQSVAPDKRLGAPFQALEYQRQGTTRVTNLRMSMICDARPLESFANLDLRASETMHFLDAFLLFARSSWTLPAPMKMPCSRPHNACLTLSPSLMMLQRFWLRLSGRQQCPLKKGSQTIMSFYQLRPLKKGGPCSIRSLNITQCSIYIQNSWTPGYVGPLPVKTLLGKYQFWLQAWVLVFHPSDSMPR